MTERPEHELDAEILTVSTVRVERNDEDLFTLAALLSVPLRHLRMLVITPALVAVGLVTIGILTARWVSESQFTPASASSSLQGLMGVAAQFGFNVGNLSGGQSVDTYGSLVQSRDLLTQAVVATYHFPSGPGSSDSLTGNLIQFYKISGRDRTDSVLQAITTLERRMSVTVDETGNTVTINVKADWPGLAEAINRRLLDGVNTFNVTQMQLQASAERRFIEQRLAIAQSDLDSAEAHLRAFLEENRTYQNSPRLQFEEQRLQARVDLHQSVYTTLAQSYEQARIAEVHNTPVTTVIDAPEGSAERHRHIVRNGILGIIVGIVLGVGLAFAREYVKHERERNPAEYTELARLRHDALGRFSPRSLLNRPPPET